MSKENYSCIFPEPKVVSSPFYPSNISSHSERSGVKQNYRTKHEAKYVDFLLHSGTALSTSFLISSPAN